MELEDLASHQSIMSANAATIVGVCAVFQAAAMCLNSAGTHTNTAQEGGCNSHNTMSMSIMIKLDTLFKRLCMLPSILSVIINYITTNASVFYTSSQ